jgi:hypothetical protein
MFASCELNKVIGYFKKILYFDKKLSCKHKPTSRWHRRWQRRCNEIVSETTAVVSNFDRILEFGTDLIIVYVLIKIVHILVKTANSLSFVKNQ